MPILGFTSNVYRIGSTALREEARKREIALRRKLLGDWEKLRGFLVPETEIARITGMSRATFYRRRRAVAKYGTQGLARRSTRPIRLRPTSITQSVRDLVLRLRRHHPTYGKAKLTVILARDHGITLSESTVGRILAELMQRGQVPRYLAATKLSRKRDFTGHARRWDYELRPQQAGEMIQIDHMTVTKNHICLKHFQAWDPITKYTHAEVYCRATSTTAAQFLATIQKALPFPIRSIQVDGGSEFMKHFEDACQAKGIPLYVLPPKRPQYNGGVERMNRTMREDLYARKDLIANDIAQFRAAVYQASRTYNHYRPHQNLDNLTPAQYFARLQAAQSQML